MCLPAGRSRTGRYRALLHPTTTVSTGRWSGSKGPEAAPSGCFPRPTGHWDAAPALFTTGWPRSVSEVSPSARSFRTTSTVRPKRTTARLAAVVRTSSSVGAGIRRPVSWWQLGVLAREAIESPVAGASRGHPRLRGTSRGSRPCIEWIYGPQPCQACGYGRRACGRQSWPHPCLRQPRGPMRIAARSARLFGRRHRPRLNVAARVAGPSWPVIVCSGGGPEPQNRPAVGPSPPRRGSSRPWVVQPGPRPQRRGAIAQAGKPVPPPLSAGRPRRPI